MKEKINYRFIIALFGNRHRGMLIPLLYSIRETNPQAKVTLFWGEIDLSFMQIIKEFFSEFEFIETDVSFGQGVAKRIACKTILWERAALEKKNENLAFIDADVILVKDISDFFFDDSDIIFTVDHENRYPLNTGVILVKNNPKVQSFFTSWRKKTKEIVRDPELYQQANDRSFPFGGADQMAFQELINFKKGKNDYQINGISITGFPREKLNETDSVPITKKTHIIHYKGGWNDILFKGKDFTANRPKENSWEMYVFYLKIYKESMEEINKFFGKKILTKDFGLKIPFYISSKNLEERKVLYPFFQIFSFFKFLPGRIVKFIKERFLS